MKPTARPNPPTTAPQPAPAQGETPRIYEACLNWDNTGDYIKRLVALEYYNTLRAQVARLTSERDEARDCGQRVDDKLAAAESELAELREDKARWKDCAEYGWTIIANASGGDWNKESKDWQAAAVRFREQYHAALSAQGEEEK